MTTTIPASEQISTLLRQETAAAHSGAENSQFMSRLAQGKLDKSAVADLTAQYFYIYSALEAAVRRAAPSPAVARVADARLERVGKLEQDLSSMLGPDWREMARPLAATKRYAAELDGLGEAHAPEVVAHHYVRYLGDIAGGQVLARVFRNEYGLDDDALHFYDFSTLGKIPPYRAGYKAALDAMPFDDDGRARLVAAAQRAFALNQLVFEELAAHSR